jgi:2-polyprenyl-6-methoxyphenol hydroxylase-like FAD-dependent oxidoreductase
MSQSHESVQAIVVGGGPAGAATAWALASQGLDVVVIDKARFPRDKPCAEYLSPQGSRILSAMGVLGRVESAGAAQLAGMRVRSPDGGIIHGEFAAQHGFSGFRDRGLALRRRHLDPILQGAARDAGASIRDGVSLQSLIRDGDTVRGVVVRDEQGERELHAPLVIGADGLRSSVARALKLSARLPWPAPRARRSIRSSSIARAVFRSTTSAICPPFRQRPGKWPKSRRRSAPNAAWC